MRWGICGCNCIAGTNCGWPWIGAKFGCPGGKPGADANAGKLLPGRPPGKGAHPAGVQPAPSRAGVATSHSIVAHRGTIPPSAALRIRETSSCFVGPDMPVGPRGVFRGSPSWRTNGAEDSRCLPVAKGQLSQVTRFAQVTRYVVKNAMDERQSTDAAGDAKKRPGRERVFLNRALLEVSVWLTRLPFDVRPGCGAFSSLAR